MMRQSSSPLSRAVLAAAALAIPIVFLTRGPQVVLACALAGACIASWCHVYARVLCGGQRLIWSRLGRSAGHGAGSSPAVVVGDLVAESVAYPLAFAGVLAWAVAVTPTGRMRLPGCARSQLDEMRRVLRWLRSG